MPPDRAARAHLHSTAAKKMVMDDAPCRPSDLGLDAAILPALLVRLGAAIAGDLRRQFAADLTGLRDALRHSLGPPHDILAVARHAHGLVALAGTAGAHTLATRSRLLLRAAHRGDADATVRLAHPLLPCIDALAIFVATCPLPAGASP